MTVEAATTAVKETPHDAEAWYALGRLMAVEGYPDRARDCFTRAVALDPAAHKPGARPRPLPREMPEWLT